MGVETKENYQYTIVYNKNGRKCEIMFSVKSEKLKLDDLLKERLEWKLSKICSKMFARFSINF